MSGTTTATLIADFEARLALLTVGGDTPEVMDRLSLWEAASARRARPTVPLAFVDVPSSTNSGQYREHAFARTKDRVRVGLLFKINPRDQKAIRTTASAWESAALAWFSDATWRRQYDVTYRTVTRGPSTQVGGLGWYEVQIEFESRRDVAVIP